MPQLPVNTNSTVFGCYGKLPSTGDFFHRNLGAQALQRWDHWLQRYVYDLQQELREAWLGYYLASPLWRFYLAPGCLDDNAYLGVLCPSVDSVGRYFPVTVLAAVPPILRQLSLSESVQDMLTAVESCLLRELEQNRLGLETFLDDLAICNGRLQSLLEAGGALPAALTRATTHLSFGRGWSAASALAATALAQLPSTSTLWWQGKTQDIGYLLCCQGLPMLPDQRTLLIGRLQDPSSVTHLPHLSPGKTREQLAAPAPSTRETTQASGIDGSKPELPTPEDDQLDSTTLLLASSALTPAGETGISPNQGVVSACFSAVGNVRDHNEDSWLERPDLGLWVVADGMGGHAHGEYASRHITQTLARLTPTGDLYQRLHQVQECLQYSNSEVLAFARTERNICGSTVVAALYHDAHLAVTWAGDSRLYRLREGALEQLTYDHDGSELLSVEERTHANASSNAITRAVGVADTVELDVKVMETHVGDRYLLCSDGVYGFIDATLLYQALSRGDTETASRQLRDCILAGSARDNLTGIVIDIIAR